VVALSQQEERWVQVTVSDDGEGISEADRERVFDPYERAHHDPGMTDSVGLGLAVSRTLARRMGGDLTYDYRDGVSRFTLRLPGWPETADGPESTYPGPAT
jgi:signal transduction histidine kinase